MNFQELLRSANKYYATIAVVIAIFLLIILYLIWLDVRLKKIEKSQEKELKK